LILIELNFKVHRGLKFGPGRDKAKIIAEAGGGALTLPTGSAVLSSKSASNANVRRQNRPPPCRTDRLLVSIDSGPVRLAGALGTPVVGLFGAIDPCHHLSPVSPGAGLFSEVACRFCHHATPRGHWQSECPNNIRCMKELEVQPVFEAVKSILAKFKQWKGARQP
jgi:hypothetical protein